jgi:hypothetical protein
MLSPFHRDNQGDDASRPSGYRHGVPKDRWMTTSTCRDIGMPHHHISQIHHDGIHHTRLHSEGIGSCSMRYKLGIMVSFISIFEAFEYVAFKDAFDYVTSAWKLFSFP